MNSISIAGLRISDVRETSLGIAWTPVGCFERNNVPVSVRILLTEDSTGLSVAGVAGVAVADSGSYTHTELQPGTVYSFQLFVDYVGNTGRIGTTVTRMTRHCEEEMCQPISRLTSFPFYSSPQLSCFY